MSFIRHYGKQSFISLVVAALGAFLIFAFLFLIHPVGHEMFAVMVFAAMFVGGLILPIVRYLRYDKMQRVYRSRTAIEEPENTT